MKINNPLFYPLQFLDQVRQKQNGDGGTGKEQYSRDQNQDKKEEKDETPVSEQSVSDAIDSFAKDTSTQSSGLSATQVGNGPGLRVVLKDGSGAVIRQFTGEEFVKLREAASQDPRPRGKLLDQKL